MATFHTYILCFVFQKKSLTSPLQMRQGQGRQGGAVADWRRVRRHDNEMQGGILGWILDQEKDVHQKAGAMTRVCCVAIALPLH